jgi:hypothetical protein
MGKDNKNKPQTIKRQFLTSNPFMYMGEEYPSTNAWISDGNGNETEGTVFADANGQYYTTDSNGNAMPVMPVHTLDEVTVTAPKKRRTASDYFGDYLTMSNDATKVLNVPHRDYNTHLTERTIRGAKSHAAWEKEHPNLAAWSYAAGAAPFAVAAYPLAAGLGDAAMGTAVGQAVRSGLTTLMANPIVDAANTGLGLGFAAKGAYDVSQGKFTPQTAIDLAGGAALGYKGLLGLNIINRTEKSNGLIPKEVWEEGIRNYKDFINSEDYANRVRRAGLSDDYIDEMRNFTDWSLENPPHRVVKVIKNNPNTLGLSEVTPNDPFYGITVKEGLSPEELKSTLIHEIAHFGTRNRGIHSTSMIGDIMRANENIAENIPWEQKLWDYPKSTPLKDINEDLAWYNYLVDPQEKRSRAIEIYQHAKDSKMSTDDFIDKFIGSDDAPKAIKDMSYIMTPDNLKKYVRNFMGIAAPIGVTTTLKQKQYEQ